ncbi:peroxisome proliferator-activated receptor gamma coactivator-related protein 1 [Trichomycterus rosablanca]|uniref:peroxisome proliferator-activated receptor gamma coactivator-related protein 1 n=1 Tax=Trichomycterus rosablanca TaxID=2290929 RepID=UPI002F354B18
MPHGDSRGKLNAGFTEFATTETFEDSQDEFRKSHTFGFGRDVCSASDMLHSSLEPSILSIFEESSAAETKIQVDEESEATLLSALSEMLDSVIEETLSPFDTLPDSELFVGSSSQDSKLKILHSLAVSPSDREPSPRRSQRSPLTNTKVEVLHSDRQLRPRLHRRTQTAIIQRSDGEEEDLSETRRRPLRIFRIESDPALCQEEQQDGFVPMLLVDLIKHMHPYSLKVALEKESLTAVHKLEEEDVFVDVEGDDDMGESVASVGANSLCDPDSSFGTDGSLRKDEPSCDQQNKGDKDATVMTSSVRVKKQVTFATNLATVYEYQPDFDDEPCKDLPETQFSETSKRSDCDLASPEYIEAPRTDPSRDGNAKSKTLSLQEYRLLRQKTTPKEEGRLDHRTKWPSIPKPPKELPPIQFNPGYTPAQVNSQTSSASTKTLTPHAASKPRRNLFLKIKSPVKQIKPVQSSDPPNPVTVPLKPLLCPVQQDISNSQTVSSNKEPNSATQVQQVSDSGEDLLVKQANCSPTISGTITSTLSAPSTPLKSKPVQVSEISLPSTQIPSANMEQGGAEEQKQQATGEIGIEATDVTSLLEQFETQGLTPPATPPHQVWKPLVPSPRAKPHKSPSKAIQIIEPKPLPPSKIHFKPQPPSSVPASSLSSACMDHDYCRSQDLKLSNTKALSTVHMHKTESSNRTDHNPVEDRTCRETERLSGSVFLSPDSSPGRLEGGSAGEVGESKPQMSVRCSTHSPSPSARGRPRKRCYRRSYQRSDSSSVSSSRSCSTSLSDSSQSPPRKRHRSRYSERSSSSSSRSSSGSLSPSPIRERRRRFRQSHTRSFSRSRSRSPQSDWNQSWSRRKRQMERYCQSRWEEAHRMQKQRAIDERRIVYVGRIRGSMTKDELRERFALFGRIEDCTVHIRTHGDNYGFVTYYNTDDAFAAIENGSKLRQPDELPFDICFGGRRQFCQSNYMDLDSNRETDPVSGRFRNAALDFDTLLKQAQQGLKT